MLLQRKPVNAFKVREQSLGREEARISRSGATVATVATVEELAQTSQVGYYIILEVRYAEDQSRGDDRD
jgi:hypothetical protein